MKIQKNTEKSKRILIGVYLMGIFVGLLSLWGLRHLKGFGMHPNKGGMWNVSKYKNREAGGDWKVGSNYSGQVAKVIYGEHHESVGKFDYGGCWEVRVMVENNSEETEIYNSNPENNDCLIPSDMEFSPNGKFLAIRYSGYEYSDSDIVNVETGDLLVNKEDRKIWIGSLESVLWNEEGYVVIINKHEDFGGEGEDNILMGNLEKEEELKIVISTEDL